MGEKWDGSERRSEIKDHDTLIEMVQILKNHVSNFNTHVDSFRSHEIKDESNFNDLKKDTFRIQRIIWIASGIIIAVESIPKLIGVLHTLTK